MKLSIITVNYNNASGLEKTIQSVFDQTFSDYEYIIIDGGSTDGSKDVIEKNKNRFEYCVSEKDSGIYNAMNKGIAVAKGEYCFFLNSGDIFHSSHVLQEVFGQHTEASTLYGDLLKGGTLIENPDKLTPVFLAKSTICHQAMFIKTELFKKFGPYREELRLVADWEFLCKTILMHKVSYGHINVIICNYDMSGVSSNPRSETALEAEREKVIMVIKPHLYNGFFLDKLNDAILRFNKKEILLYTRKINWLRVDIRDTATLCGKLMRHLALFTKNIPNRLFKRNAF